MKDRMRVAMVISSLNIAGAQNMLVELLSDMIRTDRDKSFMIVVLSRPQTNFLTEKFKQMDIPIKWTITKSKGWIGRKIEIYKNVSEILSDWQPDIIHTHLDLYYTLLYGLIKQKVIIETIHSQPYRVKHATHLFLYNLLKRKGLIYPVVLSKSNALEFGELFHEQEKNITVIPNPVDCYKFAVSDKCYASKTISFVFVARFEEIKNHDMLIKAFSIAEKIVPNICLKLVGDGTLLEQEKQLAGQLGIESKVMFMGQRSDIPTILRESDVCVISSKSEAFPLCLIEAMAAGLPVIATAVGGMRDIVDGNGYLVESDNENVFSDAMVELALDENKRNHMGKKSIELARQYNTPNVARQYIELYNNVRKKKKL